MSSDSCFNVLGIALKCFRSLRDAMDYLTLKWIHILSSTVLFGTGVGLAFFFFVAHRMRNLDAIRFATRTVVLGDFVFTAPSGIIQITTGFALAYELSLDLTTLWFTLALLLFCIAGACWLPVVWIQIKMRDLAANVSSMEELPARYWLLYSCWITLGSLAFPALVIIFWLMISKPSF